MNARLLTAAAVLVFVAGPPAFAGCPSPFVAKDGSGTNQNLGSINDASNNCRFPYAIGDGGGAANYAAVKAASTAATASDPSLVVQVSPNTPAVPTTPPANASTNLSQVGGNAVAQGGVAGSQLVEQGCAGQTVANTSVKPISLTSGSKIISGASAKNVYICAIDLTVGAADNVALVEGTGTNCGASTVGMAGGSTAATGWNWAANGGVSKGNGQGLLYRTATAADDVCLFVSGAAQVSGAITYAQF